MRNYSYPPCTMEYCAMESAVFERTAAAELPYLHAIGESKTPAGPSVAGEDKKSSPKI